MAATLPATAGSGDRRAGAVKSSARPPDPHLLPSRWTLVATGVGVPGTLVSALVLLAITNAVLASAASALDIRVAGAEEVVYSWREERCGKEDSPDTPLRFVRDCSLVFESCFSSEPDDQADATWIAATWTATPSMRSGTTNTGRTATGSPAAIENISPTGTKQS